MKMFVQCTVGRMSDDGNCLLRNLSLPWKVMDIKNMKRARVVGYVYEKCNKLREFVEGETLLFIILRFPLERQSALQ